MDMQDKEFDELFRAKLDGFEAEPSANVWPGIADELDSNKRRKTLGAWVSIAASILVLAGVGLFFIPKKTNTGTKPAENNPIAATTQPIAKPQPPQAPGAANNPVKLKHRTEIARAQSRHGVNIGEAKTIDTTPVSAIKTAADDHPFITNIPTKTAAPTKAVVPDVAVQLAVNQSIDQLPGQSLKPDKLGSQNLADSKKDSVLAKRKHRIHNFGDLVNLVVDKLDKRQDKVVQFADDEDGDSHLTGVNLGIVKIKKGE